jgi:hypothetical protein
MLLGFLGCPAQNKAVITRGVDTEPGRQTLETTRSLTIIRDRNEECRYKNEGKGSIFSKKLHENMSRTRLEPNEKSGLPLMKNGIPMPKINRSPYFQPGPPS